MKMQTPLLGLLLAVSLFVPGLQAADDDTLRQEVETLFRLTHMEEKINESVQNVAQLQLRQDPSMVQQQDILMAFLEKYIGWNAIRDELTDMYMQTFTVEELQAMNAFYSTPTGQKVITRVPELLQQRNRMAMQSLQEHISELQAAITAGK